MALHVLGKILVTEDYGTWSEGDIIISYYNDSTEAIEVTRNDATITSGEILIFRPRRNTDITTGVWYSRSHENFTFDDDGSFYKFILRQDFPYFKIFEIENDDPAFPNNVRIKSISITKASDKTTSDGSISVETSGANTPIELGLADFSYGNGTSVDTAITVSSGNYVV